MLVANAPDGGSIGVAYASSLLSLEHGGVSGWLEELYVLPQWRGRGIGSRLVAEVIAHARELGWRALDLEVEASISARSRFTLGTNSNLILGADIIVFFRIGLKQARRPKVFSN
jgi:GNAT superfamily N-acetyltransferase